MNTPNAQRQLTRQPLKCDETVEGLGRRIAQFDICGDDFLVEVTTGNGQGKVSQIAGWSSLRAHVMRQHHIKEPREPVRGDLHPHTLQRVY